MKNINIYDMTLEDIDSLKDRLIVDFDDFWTFDVLKSEILSNNSKYIVIKNDSEILGFAGIKIILDEAEIMNIVTKKEHRNQGIGKLLLEKLLLEAKNKNIKRLNLEVNESNKIAIHLYEKFGFIQNGKRKNYYIDNDAILMSKIIEK